MNREPFEERRFVSLIGPGRLQLGLMGPLFRDLGYDLTVVSLSNRRIVSCLEKDGKYEIKHHVDARSATTIPVDKAYALLSERDENYVEGMSKVSESHIVNFALGHTPKAIQAAARFLLKIEKFRRERGITDHIFITCSDNPYGMDYAIDRLRRRFMLLIQQESAEDQQRFFNDVSPYFHFIQTLADKICSHRIVSIECDKPVTVICEEYGSVSFAPEFEQSQDIPLDASVQGLVVSLNMERERKKKSFSISMCHSLAGYLGAIASAKPQTIAEAMNNGSIKAHVGRALSHVFSALKRNHPEDDTLEGIRKVTYDRLVNGGLQDDIRRVVRDVPRKLSIDDRLVGPLIYVYENCFKESDPLIHAIAAALLYAEGYGNLYPEYENDPTTLSFGKRIREEGIESVVNSLFEVDSPNRLHLRPLADRVVRKFNEYYSTR